jgi:hypothetical protein
MRFNPDLFELIPKSQLDADFGGEHTYEFDAQSYWDQIVAYVNNAYSSRRLTSPTFFFLFSYSVPVVSKKTEPVSTSLRNRRK